jgi:putative DNA primase/helicase
MMLDTIERARGRWLEILPLLGIERRFLTNRHGPCPLCGGRDRFRFDDRDGSGSYYCNQCGPGSGILLIRKLRGWDHKTACNEVDKIIGTGAPKSAQHASSNNDAAKRAAAIDRILREARYPDVVDAYLRRRGLSISSPILRGHRRCPYYDGPKQIGTFPAVIAPIRDCVGKLQSVQRIYTADLGGLAKKKVMPPVDTISGCAVHLFEPGEELGIAEGVETALACHQLFRIPTWSVLSANGIETFEPPIGISGLHIFADNDANYTGQAAAFSLARRLLQRGFSVEVHITTEIGTDWLDTLTGEQGHDQA